MPSANSNSDILIREKEILNLFKSQDIVLSANRLCDFVNDFCDCRDTRKDCIVFCNRANIIKESEKRRKFSDIKEYQDMISELLYEMLDSLDSVMDRLDHMEMAA